MPRLQNAMAKDFTLRAFGLAGAIMALAIGLRAALDPVFPNLPPFITLYPAVTLAGIFCGPAAAAAATLCGTLSVIVLWIPPRLSFSLGTPTGWVAAILFVAGSAIILWATAALRATLFETSRAKSALDRSVAEQRRIEGELRSERERLRLALEAGALAVWDYDTATHDAVIDTRYAVTMGFGAAPQTLNRAEIGRHIHPDDRPRVAAEHEAAVARGARYEIEYRTLTPSGAIRWVVSRGILLRGAPGPGRIVGIIQDITDTKRREQVLSELAETRAMLIREADHRIKNSLQLVIALLTVQLRGITDPAATEALRGAITRVGAIAASHLALQSSPDFRTLDLAVTLADLCGHFAELNPRIAITCAAQGALKLDADRAIPLALTVSELITNALRHAFTGRATGRISVTAACDAETLTIRVTDDGIGLPPNSPATGLGSRIISSLATQIAATTDTASTPGAGTTVTLRLPLSP
jgi:PAS domain S-box-containing protein